MNSNLFRGSLDTIIIKLLQENGEMYGYEISKKVEELTDGQLSLTEGSLYPSLHKLEANGTLDVEVRMVNNRHRKYYILTLEGKKKHVTLMEEMNDYLKTMALILNPQIAKI